MRRRRRCRCAAASSPGCAIGADGLPLRLVFWDGEVFDFAPAPRITIEPRTKRLIRFFATGNIGRLAEAYVECELGVEGRVEFRVADYRDLKGAALFGKIVSVGTPRPWTREYQYPENPARH